MSVADDFGRYYSKPAVLLSDCFPIRPSWADEPSLTLWMAECEAALLVRTYTANSTGYLEIVNFKQRTRADQMSKFPEFRGNPREVPESSGNSREFSAYARASPPTTTTTTTTPPATKTSEAENFGENGATESEPVRGVSLPVPDRAPRENAFQELVGHFLAAGVLLSETRHLSGLAASGMACR